MGEAAMNKSFSTDKADTPLKEQIANQAEAAKAAAQEKLDVAQQKFDTAVETGAAEFRRVSDQSSQFVRDNPGLAVAGAVGFGILLGIAMKTRN